MRSGSGDVAEESQPLQWHYTVLDDRNFEIRGRTLFFVIVVFSVLLVVTLLFLYARWVCRYRHASIPSSASHAPRVHQLPPPQGLDAAVIKGLPIILHQTEDPDPESGPGRVSGQVECCICLGVFEDGEKVKVLPQCCHCYHPECVDRWLSTQSSCPLCRASLRVDSAVPKIVVE